MAAAMNGMALRGGIIPYSGTFLVFGDYMRPSIRPAALLRQRVAHGATPDRIGPRGAGAAAPLPRLRRLPAPCDPARRPHAAAGGAWADPRQHRPRRGRADPPAGGAP